MSEQTETIPEPPKNPLASWMGLHEATIAHELLKLNLDSMRLLLMLMGVPVSDDKTDEAYKEALEVSVGMKILVGRLTKAGFTERIDKKVILFVASIIDRPGLAVLWAYTLAMLVNKWQSPIYTLNEWCIDFPEGLPSSDANKRLWDYQKFRNHSLPNRGIHDNMLDFDEYWPKPFEQKRIIT